MNEFSKIIYFPFINPNEPEMMLSSILVKNGQYVSQGDLLCILETTKAVEELSADQDGYISGINVQAGDIVKSGDFFCMINSEPTAQAIPEFEMQAPQKSSKLRITRPALKFAQEYHLNLDELDTTELITLERLKAIFSNVFNQETISVPEKIEPDSVLIYGGGGHGKSLIELIRASNQYQIGGVIDDAKPLGSKILGIAVIGRNYHLQDLYQMGFRLAINAVGGIGNISARVRVFEILRENGFSSPTVIHPTAFIENSSSIAEGCQIFPHAYVGSESQLGFGVIVNTGAIVSHDCVLGDYVNLSPGAILAGEVHVGSKTLIGMGVTINLQVQIGEHCRIGNGAVIKKDVPAHTIIHAGAVWPP